MKKYIYILIIASFLSFSSYAEVFLTQQNLEFTDLEYRSIETVDLDGDGDIDVYTWQDGNFKWYENINNEFIFHEILVGSDDNLSVFNVETPNIDFWSTTFDDSLNMTVNVYFESENYSKTELFTVSAEENVYLSAKQGDFNGDGYYDFLVTEFVDVVVDEFRVVNFYYYFNSGNNQFTKSSAVDFKLIHESSFDNGRPSIIDMNNDGMDDVVFYNHISANTGVLEYFKSSENNSYQLITISDEFSYIETFSLKFLSNDTDGLIDLFIVDGSLLWYEQVNDTFIKRELEIEPLQDNYAFFFEDYDTDGDFDLISFPGWQDRGIVKIYEFEDGAFTNIIESGPVENQQYGFQTLSTAGQSNLSFVAINEHYDYKDRLYHYRIENDQLITKQISNEFVEFIGTEVGDVSGNGLLDLVSFDRFSNQIMVTYQTAQYQFSPQVLLTIDYYPQAIHLQDIDLDGDPDMMMVASDQTGSYYQEYLNHNSHFVLSNSRMLETHISKWTEKTQFIDINNDQQMDLVVSDQFGISLEVHLTDVDTFTKQLILFQEPVNKTELSFYFDDINGDGFQDMVYNYLYYCQFVCFSTKRYRLFDESTNSFAQSSEFISSEYFYDSIYLTNLNDDPHKELVLTNVIGGSSAVEREVFSFVDGAWEAISDPLNTDRNLIRPDDYNNDGVVDFMYFDRGSLDYVFYNSTDGFQWETVFTNAVDYDLYNLMATVDLDGNGELDFISSFYPGSNTRENLLISFQGDLLEVSGTNLVPVNSDKLWALLLLVAGVCYFSRRQYYVRLT